MNVSFYSYFFKTSQLFRQNETGTHMGMAPEGTRSREEGIASSKEFWERVEQKNEQKFRKLSKIAKKR